MDGERERGGRRPCGRAEGEGLQPRAALAATGAAFSGLSTFFNARRQLSPRPSPSLRFPPLRLADSPAPSGFFSDSSRNSSISDAFATFCRHSDDRQFLPLYSRYVYVRALLSRRTTTSHRRVFALVAASENRESAILAIPNTIQCTKQDQRLLSLSFCSNFYSLKYTFIFYAIYVKYGAN